MKRGLVFAMCALALGLVGQRAHAQANINVSLNLRYTDPANPAEGGTWQLVAKTNDADGIAGLRVVLTNVGLTGATIAPSVGAITSGVGNPPGPPLRVLGTSLEVVYGQDLTVANSILGVGTGDGPGGAANKPGEIVTDPLRNATWNGASLLASGLFGATRPTFSTAVGQGVGGNTMDVPLPKAAVLANVTTTVRGDSVASLGLNTPANSGLLRGDSDRDGLVTLANDIFPAVGKVGQAGPKGWADGDWDNDGLVTLANDIFPAVGLVGQPASPAPQIGAVPEPASVALFAVAGMSVVLGLRKRN